MKYTEEVLKFANNENVTIIFGDKTRATGKFKYIKEDKYKLTNEEHSYIMNKRCIKKILDAKTGWKYPKKFKRGI